MLKKLSAATVWMLSSSVAMGAALPPGTAQYNPDLGGGTLFTTVDPAWHTAGSLLFSLDSAMTEQVGFEGLTGTVQSRVYDTGSGGVGFAYRIIVDANATADLVTGTFSAAEWLGWTIADAGADGSGSSTPAVFAPNWTDGDPAVLSRGLDEAPQVQFSDANFNGTQLDASDYSAWFWFDVPNVDSVTTGIIALQDGGSVSTASVLVAPEPTTFSLLALGSLALLRRRRR